MEGNSGDDDGRDELAWVEWEDCEWELLRMRSMGWSWNLMLKYNFLHEYHHKLTYYGKYLHYDLRISEQHLEVFSYKDRE